MNGFYGTFYKITYSSLLKVIHQKQSPDKIINEKMIATCKKTGKIFNDSMNKSGTLTNHIKEIYPKIDLPSKYKRKSIEIKTGKPWYYDYFDFK